MRSGTIRAVVGFSLAAWFALSNHCALATFATPTKSASSEAGGCPMHSAPGKKKPATETPCCKEVRAVVAKCVTANPVTLRLIATHDYATDIFAELTRVAIEIYGLDTGPPGSLSFAESVLQESVLAHAPPAS